MSQLTLTQKLMILAAAWYVLGGGIGGGSPIPDKGFRVLIVEETSDRSLLTEGQTEAMFSTDKDSIRTYVESKGGEMLVLDKDDDVSKLDGPWQSLFSRPRKALPWIEIANPPKGSEGELPKSEADAMALVKKAG